VPCPRRSPHIICTCAAGDEMPIWADILSCNEFEPEGSYVLHSIVCACLARRSEGESPALAAIEAAISRANIDRTELAPFLWTSSASEKVVNDIVDSEPNKRQALPPPWEAPNVLNRRQIVTRLRVLSCPRDRAQKHGIHK
jgi:hypothetical protein